MSGKRTKLLSLLAAGAVAVAAVPAALAASGGDQAKGNCGKPGLVKEDRGEFPKNLATKLGNGATEDSVKKALKATFEALKPSSSEIKRSDQLSASERKAKMDEVVTTLASKLGVSTDTLKGALTSLAKEKTAQGVKDGRLTQAQADEISKKIDSGDAPIVPGPHGPGGPGGPGGHGGPGGPGGPGGSDDSSQSNG